jgi:hypothetical protein
MTAHQLARALTLRARVDPDAEDLVRFAVAQVRARMTRPQRIALAARLAYVAVTGRRPW